MIFVLFPIELRFFKNKFFIKQRRHLKRLSDGEYICDKISCLRTFFHNFWRCYSGTKAIPDRTMRGWVFMSGRSKHGRLWVGVIREILREVFCSYKTCQVRIEVIAFPTTDADLLTVSAYLFQTGGFRSDKIASSIKIWWNFEYYFASSLLNGGFWNDIIATSIRFS